jgi:hypothetical protein
VTLAAGKVECGAHGPKAAMIEHSYIYTFIEILKECRCAHSCMLTVVALRTSEPLGSCFCEKRLSSCFAHNCLTEAVVFVHEHDMLFHACLPS